MSNIKKFKVGDWTGLEVVLEVDLDVLTPSLATEINNFWSESDERLSSESGDAVRTAVRLFAENAIRYFLHDGGACFSSPIGQTNVQETKAVLAYAYEGWPDFESLGIVIYSANVDIPTFDDLTLEEIL